MAISAGFEYGLISTPVFLTGLLCVAMNTNATVLNIATFGVGSAVTLLLGYFGSGGLAFRFSDVAVLRQKDFQPASRWRCAIRNWAAWTPLVVLNCLIFYLLFYSMQRDAPNVQITSSGVNATEPFLILLMLAIGPLLLMVMANVFVALISPARGAPDFVVGTRLARK